MAGHAMAGHAAVPTLGVTTEMIQTIAQKQLRRINCVLRHKTSAAGTPESRKKDKFRQAY